jgi:hypothetical protein
MELLFETGKRLLRLDIQPVALELYYSKNENGFAVFVLAQFAYYFVFGCFLYREYRHFIGLYLVRLRIFSFDDFCQIFGIP